MTREWDARIRGERPIVPEEIDGPSYLSYIKEFGTSASNNQTQLTLQISEKKTRITNKSHPFVLPGMGEDGPNCMHKVAYGIGLDGKSLGYVNHMCKRWEGPNCYKSLTMEKVFDIVLKIEAYAKVTGERPAHVTSEIIGVSSEAKTWDLDDYDTFHRRSYRHIEGVGGEGGVRIFHPYKIHKDIKDRLRTLGYGTAGKGLWQGVRDDALKLGCSEEYDYLAPHDHNFVFPSFLDEHSDNKFFLKKISVMETMEDVIRASYYLISHMGLLKESEEKDNHPIVFFGKLHRFKPEAFLTEEERKVLEEEIREKMHKMSSEEKEEASNKDKFIPLHAFTSYNPDNVELYTAYIDAFPEEYKEFWMEIIDRYKEIKFNKDIPKDDRELFIDDLVLPAGIELVRVI